MAAGLTLDSGALIAAEKGARAFWVYWKEAVDRGARITIPTPVLAQVWRDNSPVIARLLKACEVEAMSEGLAKLTGRLLARSRTSDIVDAVVVVGATARHDAILTSDPDDIARLIAALNRTLSVLRI